MILEVLFLVFVTICIVVLLVCAVYNIHLVLQYRKLRAPDPPPNAKFAVADLPFVTVQLPVYNEGPLADQCLQLAAMLDYPADRLEIQYLDDSDDGETSGIACRAIERLQRAHPDITFTYLARGTREGFKAGALAYGTERARGEFFAIFDADFAIPADFLRRTIHYFINPAIGAVQARWDYVNAGQSLFHRLQANKLDAHQMFEQSARAHVGMPVIFHGTAGVWRASALKAAGGWNCISEVEDVELSIRATLAGWRWIYLDRYRLMSELPPTINAFVRQQMRWKRGWVRVATHYTWMILRSRVPRRVKLDLMIRLHQSWGPLFAVVMVLSALPYMMVADRHGLLRVAMGLYLFALTVSLVTRHLEVKTLREDPYARPPLRMSILLNWLPLNYLLFNMGTLWALTQATIEGFFKTQIWEVTPKSGTTAHSAGHGGGSTGRHLPLYASGTLALSTVGLGLTVVSAYWLNPLAALFYLMLFLGSGYVGLQLRAFFGRR